MISLIVDRLRFANWVIFGGYLYPEYKAVAAQNPGASMWEVWWVMYGH